MGILNRISTANDNAPNYPRGHLQAHGSMDSAAVKALNEHPSPRPLKSIPNMISTVNGQIKESSTGSLKLTIGCWLAALLITMATFGLGLGTGPKMLVSLSLLWAGLWSSYVSADHGHWRLSELSVVTALGGLMGAITTAANYFGLGLTLADGLMLMSILPLLVGFVLKSRICVLASICASLLWAALSFAGLAETSNLIMLFPLIWAGQLYVATKIQSGLAITLAVIAGYYCVVKIIYTGWVADNLPLTFAAAALFVLGAAHYRSGKAAEDKKLAGSIIHTHAGWIAAMVGAIGFQYFWLTPDAVQSSNATLSLEGLKLWKGVIALSLAVVFGSSIIRYKHSQISLAGVFLLTCASAIIPMMLWFPAWPQSVIAAIPGVSAVPTIGVFIGAAILAAALGMTLNGLRRQSPVMMGMGIAVLLAEAYLLIKPNLMTIDNSVIFITGFLAALAMGAAIAGSSLSHLAPAPRLKHS